MLKIRRRAVAGQQPTTQTQENTASPRAEQQSAPEFLHRLQIGDEEAWSQLTTEWSPRLYRYLRGNLPSPEDVEDVLSETMIATVQAIKRFDGKVAISTFIYSIANRKVADFWRRRKDVHDLPETVTTSGPDSASLEFREALAQVPEEARQALLLRYHMGMSVSEVAEAVGRSYKATESLLSRGRKHLQQALANANAL
ncbi:RNA polymerase sigma factor [Chloroflexi bacterium TSY]|nr:RNA polymerase sigma factor [Chloroflexi bacterium TSY]